MQKPTRRQKRGSNDCRTTSETQATRGDKPSIRLATELQNGLPPKIACGSCRTRKIRCDHGRPKCGYCTRQDKNCSYDTSIKRRGRDRVPGSRKTTQGKKKQADDLALPEIPPNLVESSEALPELSQSTFALPSPPVEELILNNAIILPSPSCQPTPPPDFAQTALAEIAGDDSVENTPQSAISQSAIHSSPASSFFCSSGIAATPSAYLTEIQDEKDDDDDEIHYPAVSNDYYVDTGHLGSGPSASFARQTWWDTLLSHYGRDRPAATRQVTTELSLVLSTAHYWMSFLDIPLFFSSIYNPVERSTLQPALVLSLLAVGTLQKSNEIDEGQAGRTRAFWLRDAAQSALEASLNTSWIEPSLAQAALVLAFFEICPHPLHSTARSRSAILLVDALVQSLSLTCIDADDPRASIFPAGQLASLPLSASAKDPAISSCDCQALAKPTRRRCLNVSEIRKEENRRMVWAAHSAFTIHTSREAEFTGVFLPLFITNPFNFSLLFPDELEVLDTSSETQLLPRHLAKESLRALYCRLMLLWCSCLHMRYNTFNGLSGHTQGYAELETKQSTFALRAWSEISAIESAVEQHFCRKIPFSASAGCNWILGIRMLISREYSSFSPHPRTGAQSEYYRDNALQWISTQMMEGLAVVATTKPHTFAQKPMFLYLFQTQIHRCLALWELDHSLVVALNLCKTLLPPLEYQTRLWPCPEQELRNSGLRRRLSMACSQAGIPLPQPLSSALRDLTN